MDLAKLLFVNVIPSLLGPLETGGRHLRPTLIHGDLWHKNVGMDADTGKPIIWGGSPFYGHNECKPLGFPPPLDALYTLLVRSIR